MPLRKCWYRADARDSCAQARTGSAELAFDLGFQANIVDDPRLGYRTRLSPRFAVVDERYQSWFDRFRADEPDTFAFVSQSLAADYRLVYNSGSYRIYEWTSPGL